MTGPAERDVFPGRGRAAAAYALLAGVLALTVAAPIVTAWRSNPIGVESLGVLQLFAGQIALALFLACWFALQRGSSLREFLCLPTGRWGPRLAEGLRVGVIGWLVTLTAMIALGGLAQAVGVRPEEGFSDVMVWIARRPLALSLSLIMVAMAVEEAFFRAFLQPRFGLVAATLCFALGHLNYGSPVMGGGVFVIGLVLARSFRRHRDLAICAVAHGVFDAIQLLIVLPLVAAHLS